MPSQRAILHVDMDAFFAAIAVLDDPSLAGKAVLVGGTGPRGVLSTCSYEARKYGCHSAMPTAQALRLCPHAVCVKVPGKRISELSGRMFNMLEAVSPLVQPLSCDEAFVDVTGSVRLLGPPEEIAAGLKRDIKNELGLTASIGVAPNKFLAKLASDLEKPDGLTVFPREQAAIEAKLAPLDVGRIMGVGPAAQKKLASHRVRTIGDLQSLSMSQLKRIAGDYGQRLHQLAHGIDSRPVSSRGSAKSVGHERTFGKDLEDADLVRAVMLGQAEDVARRLRHKNRLAKGVSIKVRYGNFQTITRSTTLDAPSDLTHDLYRAACGLFDHWASRGFQPVRLIGVSASPLVERARQFDLFADPRREKEREIEKTLDAIKDRFGKRSVHRGA